MNALAKKIVKIVNKNIECDAGDSIDVQDVLNWMMEIDEDELVANEPEELADWFMETL